MSDRLKTDLYTIWDRGRHGISWEDSWVQDFLDDVAPDLVSAVRAGVESGTIKGAEHTVSIGDSGELHVSPVLLLDEGKTYLVMPIERIDHE